MKCAGATLVIAERNANIRELLRREFGREGYAVLTAGSGAEVLALLAAPASADLLVLDAEIDDPEGGSLVPHVTRLYPLLPVVLHVFPGFEAEAGATGAVRVEKEGDFERLKRTVRRVLGECGAG
uniref:Response regulator with CheY-like receiver, AAA-type ATPase, and DNA-binding domains n=1 Tax=Desulfovibrio sp. U5L TaxID=596152 RepID=I2Q3G6_9BACT